MTIDSQDAVLALSTELIKRASITPLDEGCIDLLIERLQPLGFQIEKLNFADEFGEVTNLWARRGNAQPCVVFAGHTDVVPTGDSARWISPPFEPTIIEGNLYGRGAADMKTSIAAFIVAIERFIQNHNDHEGSIALLITSDEEGPATCGTRKVIEHLNQRGETIDYCIVGEPSSTARLGDVIKNGRRGSLGAELVVHGVQGHIAYPEKAHNPIPDAARVITALTEIEWDQGNEYFQPTSLQFSNVTAGTGAGNMIPGTASLHFNFRYSPELTAELIQQRVKVALDALNIEYEITWRHFGLPFLTPRGTLVNACELAIQQECGYLPELSTGGGTSDGRFIAPTGAEVVELGPINATIHKLNEHVPISCMEPLAGIYQRVLVALIA